MTTENNYELWSVYTQSDNNVRSTKTGLPQITNTYIANTTGAGVKTPLLTLTLNTAVTATIIGYQFKVELLNKRAPDNLLRVYLSGSNPGMFSSGLKEYNFFSANERLSAETPPFSAVQLYVNAETNNVATIVIPPLQQPGVVNIITLNPIGYTTLETLDNTLITVA